MHYTSFPMLASKLFSHSKTMAASALALMCLASCGPKFSVSGEVSDSLAGVEEVALYEVDLVQGEKFIKYLPVKGGKFSYSGRADRMKVYNVIAEEQSGQMHGASFVSEPGSVSVSFTPDGPVVGGGAITDTFLEFENAVNSIYSEHEDLLLEKYQEGEFDVVDSIQAVMNTALGSVYDMAFESNNDNAVGLVAIMGMIYDLGYEPDQIIPLYESASELLKKDPYLSSAIEAMKASENTAVGKPFVDFSGKDAADKKVSLSDYVGKGSYVLTDFWASWCVPCMNALPTLRRIRDDYKDRGLTVVGVNVFEQEKGKGQECAKDRNMDWDIMFVEDESATTVYGIQAIPTLILFGPDGTILEKLTGEAGLEEMIQKYLGE